MQKIFWLGNPYFQASLPAYDWHVAFHNFTDMRIFTWDDIVRLAGFEPDILVVADKSLPPFVLGMENFPCFTILYVVDSHIHSWHPYYAQAFDACLVSLRDHIPFFQNKYIPSQNIHWSPAFAKDDDKPNFTAKQQWDCLFVGTVDAETTPARKVFLEELQKHVPLHITQGRYAELFPQGKVILNYCEYGDVNFRIFEALACGSALLSPWVEHGVTELFTHEREVLFYDKDQMSDVISKVNFLLNHEGKRKSLAEQGYHTVNTQHRATHRAYSFTNFLQKLGMAHMQECVDKRRNNAANILHLYLRMLYLHMAETSPLPALRKAYLQAIKK